MNFPLKSLTAMLSSLILRSIVDILGLSTPLANNLPSLLRLPLLLFLQLLSGLFPQKKPQFLLSLGGHEPLLGLLPSGLGLEPGPDLGLLPVDLGLLLIIPHGGVF